MRQAELEMQKMERQRTLDLRSRQVCWCHLTTAMLNACQADNSRICAVNSADTVAA